MSIPPTIRANILINIFIYMAASHVFIIPLKSEKIFILGKSEYFVKMYDA